MKTIIFSILIITIIGSLFVLLVNIKFFLSELLDNNDILISRTINFLVKVYNNEISKENIGAYKDIYKKCLSNKLVVEQKNHIKLSEAGLSICFQYTNNKYIIINIIFTIAILLLSLYSIIK